MISRPLSSLLIVVLLTFAGLNLGFAQVRARLAPERSTGSYPIIGSHLLRDQQLRVQKYISEHPNMMAQMKAEKPTAWNFKVGDEHAWYATDFTTSSQYLDNSTCWAVGVDCYIFVEDSLWNNRVTQDVVDSVEVAFDLSTPANPSEGVFEMDTAAFGKPPDVDNDPRIIILIMNIRDGYTGSGGYVAGYFNSLNETDLSGSNDAEIIYIDADPQDLTSADGLESGMSTTAHEFQHMIHYNYDPSEISFVNEGCSLVAEVNCGFPIYDQSGYIGETDHYLLDWRSESDPNVARDYSRAARFMTYLRDQLTMGVFKPIVASTLHGIAGINAGLTAFGAKPHFADIFQRWLIANILDDTTLNRAYGYVYPDLPKVICRSYYNPNVALTTDTVQKLGARYLAFKAGGQLHVNFTVSNPAVLIRAVETGPSLENVLNVTPGTPFSEPNFGSTVTEVDFVVMDTSQTTTYTYTYQASGVAKEVELKWDQTEPTGYLQLDPGDTVCAIFDSIPGGHLDSVRVGLRKQNTMVGGVWQLADTASSFLGKLLIGPFTATGTLYPPHPYPVPWPNWGSVDLHTFSVNINHPFAVAFVVGHDSMSPMVTPYASSDAYNNFTYLQAAEVSPAGWYYLTENDAGDTIWVYLIRAYVSFSATGVSENRELIPRSFVLQQNYPNPFNPSTILRYELPSSSFVSLKVYDILGREVATLVESVQQAGEHTVRWDGSNRPSGVYYYRMVASNPTSGHETNFSAVRKMIIVR